MIERRSLYILAAVAAFILLFLAKSGPLRNAAPEATPRGRKQAVGDVVSVWLAVALLVGFLEIGLVIFRREVQGRMVFWSLHEPWLTPAAYVVLLGVPAVVLVIAALLRPRFVPLQIPALVLVAMGAEGLMLSFPKVHHWAQAILAVGVAFRLSELAGTRPRPFRALARRTAVVLSVATVLIAALTSGTASLREARRLAALQAAPLGAPNVLILILDTVRSASLSAYGYDRPTTPNLEAIAEQGVLFDWPIAPSNWTLPTHVAVMTGRYHSEASAGYLYPLDETFPTLPSRLKEAGYATAAFVANRHYASAETGLGRGFIHYDDYLGSKEFLLNHAWLGQTSGVQGLVTAVTAGSFGELLRAVGNFSPRVPRTRSAVRRSAAEINEALLAWLDDRGRVPFFALLNYYDAHLPYESPEPYRTRFLDGAPSELVGQYDGAIAYIDAEIGRLLSELDQRGLSENTILVITSDHGEHLGEKGKTGHGNSMYSQLLRVPLILRLQGRVPGALRPSEPVSLADLPRTILDLTDVDPTGFPGASLARVWGDDVEGTPSPLLSEWTVGPGPAPPTIEFEDRNHRKSVLVGDHHYMTRTTAEGIEEELFNIRSDPEEASDLSGTPAGRELANRLRSVLREIVNTGNPSELVAENPRGRPLR